MQIVSRPSPRLRFVMVSLERLARLLTLSLLLIDFRISSSSECSRHLPEVSNQSSLGSLSGDIQLLIPAWRFNCTGTVLKWEALVQGNLTSSPSGIEFQVFQPDLNNSDIFNVFYGNAFDKEMDSQNDSQISLEISSTDLSRTRLPINAGYIVGVRLINSSLQLLYNSSSDDGVDVYYWENQGSVRNCNFSLCDSSVKVLTNVMPLISWNYDNRESLVVENLILDLARDTNYCSLSVPEICPTSSSPISSSVAPTPSASQYSGSSSNSSTITSSVVAGQPTSTAAAVKPSSASLVQPLPSYSSASADNIVHQTPFTTAGYDNQMSIATIIVPTATTDYKVPETSALSSSTFESSHQSVLETKPPYQSHSTLSSAIATYTLINQSIPQPSHTFMNTPASLLNSSLLSVSLNNMSATASVNSSNTLTPEEHLLLTSVFSVVIVSLSLAIILTSVLIVVLGVKFSRRYSKLKSKNKKRIARSLQQLASNPCYGQALSLSRNIYGSSASTPVNTSTPSSMPTPLEPLPELFEDRDYAEVEDYSVPRPSIVVTQMSPPYANLHTPSPFTVKLPAGNPQYENTVFDF